MTSDNEAAYLKINKREKVLQLAPQMPELSTISDCSEVNNALSSNKMLAMLPERNHEGQKHAFLSSPKELHCPQSRNCTKSNCISCSPKLIKGSNYHSNDSYNSKYHHDDNVLNDQNRHSRKSSDTSQKNKYSENHESCNEIHCQRSNSDDQDFRYQFARLDVNGKSDGAERHQYASCQLGVTMSDNNSVNLQRQSNRNAKGVAHVDRTFRNRGNFQRHNGEQWNDLEQGDVAHLQECIAMQNERLNSLQNQLSQVFHPAPGGASNTSQASQGEVDNSYLAQFVSSTDHRLNRLENQIDYIFKYIMNQSSSQLEDHQKMYLKDGGGDSFAPGKVMCQQREEKISTVTRLSFVGNDQVPCRENVACSSRSKHQNGTGRHNEYIENGSAKKKLDLPRTRNDQTPIARNDQYRKSRNVEFAALGDGHNVSPRNRENVFLPNNRVTCFKQNRNENKDSSDKGNRKASSNRKNAPLYDSPSVRSDEVFPKHDRHCSPACACSSCPQTKPLKPDQINSPKEDLHIPNRKVSKKLADKTSSSSSSSDSEASSSETHSDDDKHCVADRELLDDFNHSEYSQSTHKYLEEFDREIADTDPKKMKRNRSKRHPK